MDGYSSYSDNNNTTEKKERKKRKPKLNKIFDIKVKGNKTKKPQTKV